MIFLLDTHILLWWCHASEKVPQEFLGKIEGEEAAGRRLGISIISLWEIAKLVEKGRVDTAVSLDQWFPQLESHPTIEVLPLTGRIILESQRLGDKFPRDPSDQLIAATARVHGLRLMTVDENIAKSGVVAIA